MNISAHYSYTQHAWLVSKQKFICVHMCLFHIEVEKVFNFHIQLIVARTIHAHHNTLPCHFSSCAHILSLLCLADTHLNSEKHRWCISLEHPSSAVPELFGIHWSKHCPRANFTILSVIFGTQASFFAASYW